MQNTPQLECLDVELTGKDAEVPQGSGVTLQHLRYLCLSGTVSAVLDLIRSPSLAFIRFGPSRSFWTTYEPKFPKMFLASSCAITELVFIGFQVDEITIVNLLGQLTSLLKLRIISKPSESNLTQVMEALRNQETCPSLRFLELSGLTSLVSALPLIEMLEKRAGKIQELRFDFRSYYPRKSNVGTRHVPHKEIWPSFCVRLKQLGVEVHLVLDGEFCRTY